LLFVLYTEKISIRRGTAESVLLVLTDFDEFVKNAVVQEQLQEHSRRRSAKNKP
jgi:hypothetical protein